MLTIDADPIRSLPAEVLTQCLGLVDPRDLRTLEMGGTVICISRTDRGVQREYPAFQVWPGIAGEPIQRIISALSTYAPADSVGTYGFFTSPDKLLGELTPIEVLLGRLLSPRGRYPEAMELLEWSPDRRLEAVLGSAKALAECWNS